MHNLKLILQAGVQSESYFAEQVYYKIKYLKKMLLGLLQTDVESDEERISLAQNRGFSRSYM